MDVIHMAAVILLIPDQMFPIMALPNAPLPVTQPGLAAPLVHRQGAGKVAFDQPPPQGEIGVSFRQRENAVEMVGQHHPCMNGEGVSLLHLGNAMAQQVDLLHQQPVIAPLQQVDGKEPGSSGPPCPPPIGHPFPLVETEKPSIALPHFDLLAGRDDADVRLRDRPITLR